MYIFFIFFATVFVQRDFVFNDSGIFKWNCNNVCISKLLLSILLSVVKSSLLGNRRFCVFDLLTSRYLSPSLSPTEVILLGPLHLNLQQLFS
jgi:hypothetical protein